MKPATPVLAALALAGGILMMAGCSNGAKGDADDQPAAKAGQAADSTDKGEAKSGGGVTLDADTQERIGIKTETPAPAQWQPGINGIGRVVNPLTLISAVTDLETAKTAASASNAELERTQKLAAQENASSRVLEAAQAAAARDALALQAARAKFAADWGLHLSQKSDLGAFAADLSTNNVSLVKLFLSAGTFPNPLPAAATISLFNGETNAFDAELADNLNIDPSTQVQTLLFSVKQKLPPDAAVEAHLKISGEPLAGVVVPAGAVLRYEGKGWVYVQAGTNRFERAEVPLDRLLPDGWFVSEELAATNRIVVTGAQTVLSAELSSGAFSTGERD